jgi:hypothetical protein
MKSLFTTEAHTEILNRLEKLDNQMQPQWGKMNVSQMLTHCRFPLQVALQDMTLEKPNVFKRLLFSMFKSSLYDDKPWKKGLPTTKEFIVNVPKDFHSEKTKLVEKINQFHAEKSKTDWPPHPMFGNFTSLQWGKMQYKHLDHHLKQFGV